MTNKSNSASQIKKGAIYSYISLFLTNIVGLFVTPYMLGKLGNSEYGLYMLIGSIVGYLVFLDFGLNNSIIRYVARYRALNDIPGEQNFLALSMMTYIGISIVSVFVGIVLYWNLDLIFGASLTVEEMHRAKIMFVILIFNVTISFPSGAVTAIVSGYERFAFAKGITLIRYIIRTLLLVALLYFGYKAVAIVVLDTVMNLLLFVLNLIYIFFRLRVRFVLHKFDKKLIYEVAAYSFWMSVALIFAQMYPRIGQILLGMTEGTAAVAVFAVSMLIVSYYESFGYIFTSMLLPYATKLVALGTNSIELTNLMIKIGRIQFLIMSFVLGGFILLGNAFVILWVGEAYGEAWIISLIVMIPATAAIVRDAGVSIQQAQNRNVFRAFYCMFLAAATAIFSLLALNFFNGPLAMGVGTSVTVSIGCIIYSIYYTRVIKIDMKRLHKEVFIPQIFCMLIAVLLGEILIFYYPVTSWMMFAAEGLVYSIVFIVITWFFGMNDFEKRTSTELLGTVAKRLRFHSAIAK